MALRKILGLIGNILILLAIMLAVIIGLLLATNAVDEDPTPELEALLTIPQSKAVPENGFVALVGSAIAPANADFVEYGRQWLETYNAANDKAAIAAAIARFPAERIGFVGDEKQLCDPMKANCLPQARERAAVWRQLAADNEMMLARQRRLMEFSRFDYSYFPSNYESPVPAYAATASRQLLLDLIALDAAEGRMEPALAALQACIAFDRLALFGSGDVFMTMISANWLRQDYALLAEIMATRAKTLVSQKPRLLQMTEPLEIEQLRSIAATMLERELLYLVRSIDATNGSPNVLLGEGISVWERPFFKLQATLNMEVRHHAAFLAQVRAFSPEQAEAWKAGFQQNTKAENDKLIRTWSVLYNPVGKMYSGATEIGYDSYVLKLSDLMGITRLARLQVELATDGKADADISARIAANQALYDPYTGKPMGWDADKQHLYFDVHGNAQYGVANRVAAGI